MSDEEPPIAKKGTPSGKPGPNEVKVVDRMDESLPEIALGESASQISAFSNTSSLLGVKLRSFEKTIRLRTAAKTKETEDNQHVIIGKKEKEIEELNRHMETERKQFEEEVHRRERALRDELELERRKMENIRQQAELVQEEAVQKMYSRFENEEDVLKAKPEDFYDVYGNDASFITVSEATVTPVSAVRTAPVPVHRKICYQNESKHRVQFKNEPVVEYIRSSPAKRPLSVMDDENYDAEESWGSTQKVQASDDFSEKMLKVLYSMKLPPKSIKKFCGDPRDFITFKRSFESVITTKENELSELMDYLLEFTDGEARRLIATCQFLDSEVGYPRAWALLTQHFGLPIKVTQTYLQEVTDGPSIKAGDIKSLKSFSISLAACTNILLSTGQLHSLNSTESLRKICDRLPFHLYTAWQRVADRIMYDDEGRDVTIEDVCGFVETSLRRAENPLFPDRVTKKKDGDHVRQQKQRIFAATSDGNNPTSGEGNTTKYCYMCSANDHYINYCQQFRSLNVSERRKFVLKTDLCFACLSKGHKANRCFRKNPCLKKVCPLLCARQRPS